MAGDDEGGEGEAPVEGAAAGSPEERIAALERDLTKVARLQQHQRLQQMSLHGALVQLDAALKGGRAFDLPEPLKPVSFLDNPRDDILFFAFAGLNLGVGIPAFEFRRTLGQHRAPGYFIKDFHQSWYQQGLLGLADDLAGARDYLAGLKARHGVAELVTLGASTGGYAAILFGCWLGAKRVVAFSPQTGITRRVAARFAQLDTPPDFLRRGEPLPDLAQVVADSPSRPQITVYYGAGHRHDVHQAERLKGLDNVELVPVEGAEGHAMAAELRRRGELDAVLAGLLGEGAG